MMQRIWQKRGVSLAMRFVFRLIDRFWPKDENLVVFSGGRDVGYSDNSRFLFERFIEEYGKELRVLWVTPSKDVLLDNAISTKYRSHMVYQYSTTGVISLLRAKTIFFCWGSSDLPGTDFSKRTVVIQLWHGIPIKRIGIYSKQLDKGQKRSAIRAYQKFTYWACSSKIERNSVALCTGLPIERVRVTGYPRNDYLIEHKNSGNPLMQERFPFLDKRVILYAPTYRSKGMAEFFPFTDYDDQRLDAFLRDRDAYLVLRTHHVDDVVSAREDRINAKPFCSDRIVILNRRSIRDVQEVLPYVDILVSDYSGIWLDFLLLDRPVIFVPYDLLEYEEADGLLYDYDFITPGPKVLCLNDLLTELDQYLSNSARDSTKRENIRRMFHEHEDGMAYKRLYQLVKEAESGNH